MKNMHLCSFQLRCILTGLDVSLFSMSIQFQGNNLKKLPTILHTKCICASCHEKTENTEKTVQFTLFMSKSTHYLPHFSNYRTNTSIFLVSMFPNFKRELFYLLLVCLKHVIDVIEQFRGKKILISKSCFIY